MFDVRLRSHHDAEHRLATALGTQSNSRRAGVSWNTIESALKANPPSKRRCVYFHVPYCDKICSFCNLNRQRCQGIDLEAYTQYLIGEIHTYARFPYVHLGSFDAVYFGGGTPTVLSGDQFERILSALRSTLNLSPNCEITVESTLHNLPTEKVRQLAENGVNRFSIGVQTFSTSGRITLNRTWNPERAVQRLSEIRTVFSGVLGIDIIYSYPDQTIADVRADAAYCHQLKLDGVSFYSLMIHDGSTLGKRIASGRITFDRSITEDLARHNCFYSSMRKHGYRLLELSKLVIPGRDEYRYIRIRYGNGDVLPIGAGAGGKLAGYRIYSMAPGRRVASPVHREYCAYHEVLGLLQFGIYSPSAIAEKLGFAHTEALENRMEFFRGQGLLTAPNNGTYQLTADGVFWGNNVAVDILETAVASNREAKHA